MGTIRKTFLIVLAWGLAWSSCGPLRAGDEEESVDPSSAFSWGTGGAFDLHYSTAAESWQENLDASIWVEADLGTLIGLHDFYLYANPSVTWGTGEEWAWTVRFYQWWLAWDSRDDLNVMVGGLDPGWHFHSMPSAGNFVRMASRLPGEFSPGSLNLPEPDPISPLAARIEWKPFSNWVTQAAVFAMEEGDEIDSQPIEETFPALAIAEFAWRDEGEEASGWKQRVFGLGAWTTPQGPTGTYVFGDAKLFTESPTSWQGLSAFFSLGGRTEDDESWKSSGTAGLTWEGLIPGRDEDLTSLALIADERPDRAELSWELLHRFPLSEHTWAQVEVQSQNAGSHVAASDDWKLGLRLGWDW